MGSEMCIRDRIDCDKKVFPMVAPGAPISDIMTEEDFKEQK